MGIAWFKSLAAIGYPKFESPHGGDRSFVCRLFRRGGFRISALVFRYGSASRGSKRSTLQPQAKGARIGRRPAIRGIDLLEFKGSAHHGFLEREDIDASVSEDDARAARIAFFSGYLSDQERETAILTGHHAGDVLETMLMRISRGSGLQGLTAPREVSRGPDGLLFFRPLLRLRKDRIVDYLRQAGAEWREDASNQTDAYYRNRLRSSVIPDWENVSDRPVQEGAVTARALLEEDWEALEHSFDDAWKTMILDGEYRLDWAATRAQPRAFQRRALNRLVETEAGSCLALASVETILESLRTGEDFKTNVTASHWVVGDETDGIRVISDSVSFYWDELGLPDDCTMFLPDGSALSSQRVHVDEDLFNSIRSGAHSHDSVVFIRV